MLYQWSMRDDSDYSNRLLLTILITRGSYSQSSQLKIQRMMEEIRITIITGEMHRGIELTIKQESSTRTNSIINKQALAFRQTQSILIAGTSPKHKRIGFKSPFPRSVFEANQILFKHSEKVSEQTGSNENNTNNPKVGCLKNKASTQYLAKSKKIDSKKVRFDLRENNHQENPVESRLRFKTPINKEQRMNSPAIYVMPSRHEVLKPTNQPHNTDRVGHKSPQPNLSPKPSSRVKQRISQNQPLLKP